VNHFGPIIAAELRKRRPKPHAVWHLDEVYLKIDGRMAYLWPAVDAEGEVLDVLVQFQAQQACRVETDAQASEEIRRRSRANGDG
jgi:putative transposase